MTKKPHEDTRLAKYIERRVLELKSKKSQLQIASEAERPSADFVTVRVFVGHDGAQPTLAVRNQRQPKPSWRVRQKERKAEVCRRLNEQAHWSTQSSEK